MVVFCSFGCTQALIDCGRSEYFRYPEDADKEKMLDTAEEQYLDMIAAGFPSLYPDKDQGKAVSTYHGSIESYGISRMAWRNILVRGSCFLKAKSKRRTYIHMYSRGLTTAV